MKISGGSNTLSVLLTMFLLQLKLHNLLVNQSVNRAHSLFIERHVKELFSAYDISTS